MPPQMIGSTYKAVDVAKHIGVTRQTLHNMLKDGRFTVEPIPGTKPRRWRAADIESVYGPTKAASA